MAAFAQTDQTITFTSAAPTTATVGGATYTPTATSTSGDAVVFSIDGSSTAGACSGTSVVSFTGAGTCVVDANQAGDANYNAATQVQQSITVSAAAKTNQTITITSAAPATATVGGATYTPAATSTSGDAVVFSIDGSSTAGACSGTSVVSFTGAGTCVVDANQAGDANYNAAPQVQQSITVSAAAKTNQTITFTSAAPAPATVGGATYTPTANGGGSGIAVVFSIGASSTAGACSGTSVVSFTGAGTCVVDANQAGDANYNAAPQVSQSITVSAAAKTDQTITFTSAAPATATVGGATYTPTANGGGSGIAVVFSIGASSTAGACSGTSVVSFTGVGTCIVDANQAGNTLYNAATQVSQSITVSAAAKTNQTITITSAAPATATVGGATYTPAATSTSGLAVVFSIGATSTAGACSGTSVVSFTGAGTCVVDANQAGNTLYNAAPQVAQSVTVSAPTDAYSYNAAGGAPTPASSSGLNGTSIILAAAPTRAGFTFQGWNDGTSTFAASISYPLSSDGVAIVFTAQWTANATGGGPPPSETTLDQTSPTSGVTTSENSGTFTAGPITVSHATGAVSFVITTSSKALSVSPLGAITTSGSLLAGSYSVSGTDSDTNGDTGTWTFTLTVYTPITATFVANGGQGSMSPETKSAPTALTPNVFTRAKHAFTKWNTAADGSGTSYVNGATYAFTAAVTLYAQWVATSHPATKHRVTFNANGGTRTMATQTNSVLATLASNAFTRAGYTFKGWNTMANGSGTSYANGAAYRFAKSATLYAQWKKIPRVPAKPEFTVAFVANGGKGAMASEKGRTPAALSKVTFTRAGYAFRYWNTKPGGSGANYANGAQFPFVANITLYAQWHHNKVVVPPAVPASASIDPFAPKSSSLTSSLESQINAVAATVKANHDTKIALVGYGDELSKADQLNESIWAANFVLSRDRARAVETYLRTQLAALGVHSFTISAEGYGSSISGTTSSTTPARYAVVTATLT
jgi:uncharacterized repeat protein (TIGR02543 family)